MLRVPSSATQRQPCAHPAIAFGTRIANTRIARNYWLFHTALDSVRVSIPCQTMGIALPTYASITAEVHRRSLSRYLVAKLEQPWERWSASPDPSCFDMSCRRSAYEP